MRVIFWTEYYAPCIGGIETIVGLLAEALVREGHSALVVTNLSPSGVPASEVIRGVQVHRFNMARALQERNLLEVRRVSSAVLALKRSFVPDLEHIHATGPIVMVHQLVHRDFPVPIVSSLHCTHDALASLARAKGAAFSLLLESLCVITPSEMLAAVVRQEAPAIAARVRVAAPGITWQAADPAPLPFDPPVILCYGRVVREKGFDLALQALAGLAPEIPGLRMIIAGDGVERVPLQALARELQLEGIVEFPGWVQPADIPALLQRATFVLIPSRWQEPFATTALEAAHLGRPVITTDVGGMRESVVDGSTGFLVENENVTALAGAMRHLLLDAARTRQMGAAARARSLDHFTFARYFKMHLDLYATLVPNQPGVAAL